MRDIDTYSYRCGVMDCFCEMVRAGVKNLALSHPVDSRAEWEELGPFAAKIAGQYGVKCYPEEAPLVTDLFPLSATRGKYLYLFYRADHVLGEYLRLKERKASMVAERAYFGGNRTQIAREYGRLLSYSPETVRSLLAANSDRERV